MSVAVLLDLLVGAAGLPGDADEQALVDEPVGDGGGGGGVVEELAPVLEGEIGGDDGGGALIAAIEDLVEEVGAAGIEGEVAQLVDEEQVAGEPRTARRLLRVLRAWAATRSLTRSAARTKRTR